MTYVGIQTQKQRNNVRSTVLLVLFPVLVLVLSYIAYFLFFTYTSENVDNSISTSVFDVDRLLDFGINVAPFVILIVAVWFLIAYASNSAIINRAVGSKPLERKHNMRIYNLVENLCMEIGMKMPKVNVIQDESLNAFASGINAKTYTVTLTIGIINKLNDEELKGVIAHELTHIRNRDVRVLIVSIVFVGIFAMISQIGFRALLYSGNRSSRNDKNGGGQAAIIAIVVVIAIIGYICSILMKFAISRNREYMADAGAAEMTRNPLALASALRKISADPDVEAVQRDDVAQLFIEHPIKKSKRSFMTNLFATHPPIAKRIAVLEGF